VTAQQVTTVAPPAQIARSADAESADGGAEAPPAVLPDAPEYPDAVPMPDTKGALAKIDSDTGKVAGSVAILDGHVLITYRNRTLQADHIEYDHATGEVTLTGHVVVEGGDNQEHIEASHATFNLRSETGKFYDVTGSVGLRRTPATAGPAPAAQRAVYANSNPFLFTGKIVVKTGPRDYEIYGGTVTSCQMPHPDWLLSAGKFSGDGTKAHAANSIFRLMGIPLLWLPYATHPMDASDRQTGILIPDIGFNSASKGDTIGEQIYWAINRSTDMTVGTIYYSARGWERTAGFRYRGLGQDFARANYSALQDRGYTPTGGTYVNQSGTDVLFSGRKDLMVDEDATPGAVVATQPRGQARLVADVEYLSSFPYREAFSSNFNQAVSSDVVSTAYATREWNGMAASVEGDRYEGEKRIATTNPPQAEEQVRIFHAPALEFDTTDHPLGTTGLEWSLNSSVAGLKRTQPGFATGGLVERLDLHPEIAFPFGFAGWRVRPSVGGRETFYSRSRLPAGAGGAPVESTAPLNRADLEIDLDVRPPVLERTFDTGFVSRLLGQSVKHTIEPELTYRYVSGINNFSQVLRFDVTDVASDSNEVEYGVTQRLFLRPTGNRPCRAAGQAADATEILGLAGTEEDAIESPGESLGRTDTSEPVCGNREWISWRVAQKYFFDSHFGGAVVGTGPRDTLETTLDFSGISFLTGPRSMSPLLSRLRVRTSEKTDVEWDFDYDASSGKFTSNNIYADVHQRMLGHDLFAGAGYARLNAPSRSYVEGVLSSVADFNQMRALLGFGRPTQPGWSAAASAGVDLDLGTVQYGAIQTSYNWNCCGVSVEYRKYELGTARNDNGYKFNFTLANIGSAGNLRHADQVF